MLKKTTQPAAGSTRLRIRVQITNEGIRYFMPLYTEKVSRISRFFKRFSGFFLLQAGLRRQKCPASRENRALKTDRDDNQLEAACASVMAAVTTMSSALQPLERSDTGFAKPWRIGP